MVALRGSRVPIQAAKKKRKNSLSHFSPLVREETERVKKTQKQNCKISTHHSDSFATVPILLLKALVNHSDSFATVRILLLKVLVHHSDSFANVRILLLVYSSNKHSFDNFIQGNLLLIHRKTSRSYRASYFQRSSHLWESST